MGQKLVIGPLSKGLRKDVTAFNVDNDSFPTLINAYQWRLRCRRKRGTAPFTRLQRQIHGLKGSVPSYYSSFDMTDGSGAFSNNLVTFFSITAPFVPLSISIKIDDGGGGFQTFTDDGKGVLSNGGAGTGTINYATGDIAFQTDPALNNSNVFIIFSYYPILPVLGAKNFIGNPINFPGEISFDTTYAYNINLSISNTLPLDSPYLSWNISYYRNDGPSAKTDWTPFNWNLKNYQQMWTTNYQGALWAIPGIQTFDDGITNAIGMQFQIPSAITAVGAGPPGTITFTMPTSTLKKGDFVFANEFTGIKGDELNYQTGYVTDDSAAPSYVITFPQQTFTGIAANYTVGILQFLTNSSDTTKDCIRWYNGAPVTGAIPPVFANNQGWVNFCPPLTTNNIGTFSIAGVPPSAKPYYLVGARMAVPFKDRLLFFGPVIENSAGTKVYLQDTVIYSQSGTVYYTASFPFTSGGAFPSPAISYTPLLVPENKGAQSSCWLENVTGYGGFINADYSQPISTVSINEDALILGLTDRQARLLYTGNDIVPFNFYIINSELGSEATFSAINLDRGVITLGSRGFVLTSQISSQRIDLEIPDEVFRLDLTNQGAQRTCAQRDFINEWIYFTYPNSENETSIYPDTTLQYNYRDGSWAMFKETYTTYGTIHPISGNTWLTLPYDSWWDWSDPWNAGQTTEEQPQVVGGNAQGFILLRGQGTGESPSSYIKSVSGSEITSPNHGLLNDDYILIQNCLGTAGQTLNGKIFQVTSVTQNTFNIIPPLTIGTYEGNGLITRYYVPYIQSKQFPTAWEMGRKTRLGYQQYLFSTTDNAQITLLIFLSQSGGNPYNTGPIVPDSGSTNNSLIYNTTLYTCPESINLGLTSFNTNLQMVTAATQEQIWHRINTSLIGDTVQFGFTMSNAQMSREGYIPLRNNVGSIVSYNITGATQANPCVLTCDGQFSERSLIKIENVEGMTQLNYNDTDYNYYEVISSDGTNVTINIDSTGFDAYTTGGTATQIYNPNVTAEITFHSAILDLNPSQMLS